ncbi:hypothetical protein ACFLR4_00715 [Bacteroidota bacterium]
MKQIISLIRVTLLAFFIFIDACSQETPSQNLSTSNSLTGPYLGQESPGLQAVRFPAQDYLSNSNWFWHGPLSFSPDGTEMYMTKYLNNGLMQINWARIVNNNWTLLETASFAAAIDENNPFVHADGNVVYFISDKSSGRFWKSERTDIGWSNPENINIPDPEEEGGWGWQMSVTRDHSIYFDYMMSNGFNTFVSRFVDGVYQTPERLPDNINADEAFTPFIDPDEEYIIFSSRRDGTYGSFDLFISFKNEADSWSDPVNMGNLINSPRSEFAPYVTIDENHLFFFTERIGDSGYNPYWISSEVIENLR